MSWLMGFRIRPGEGGRCFLPIVPALGALASTCLPCLHMKLIHGTTTLKRISNKKTNIFVKGFGRRSIPVGQAQQKWFATLHRNLLSPVIVEI